MFFREFNRPHATMEVTVSYFWSGVAMVTLSVLNRKVVEEHFLRNLANVYLRLMYMCSMYVYIYVCIYAWVYYSAELSFEISCLFDINRCKHQFA